MTSGARGDGHEYFDEAEFAQRERLEETHFWHVHRRRLLLRELTACVPAEDCGRLLEIGCGIGTVATFLNENGYAVDYADYFENAISISKRRAGYRLGTRAAERAFMRVDVTRPLALERHYTGVLLLDVIEHLPDDELVLANVRDALEDRGHVMVTVPAFQTLWSPWDDMQKHKRRYTQQSLTRVLTGCGFQVRRSTYFFAPLFFAALATKLVRAVRRTTFGAPPPRGMDQLVEAKNNAALNQIMLGILSPEQRLLPKRSLPFGTSVLAIATKR